MATTSPRRVPTTPLTFKSRNQSPVTVWAWPHDRSNQQQFQLCTASPNAELVPGDIVTALPDHGGDLHVTKVTALIGHFTIVFPLLSAAGPEDVEDLLELFDDYDDRLHELPDGRCLFVWDDFYHLPLEETVERLSVLTAGSASEHLLVTSQAQRHRLLSKAADFRLPATPLYPRVLHDTIAALHERMRHGGSSTAA